MEVLYLLSYGSMAPQAGLEPATNRLTADCSTTELLRNGYLKAWQRPTLAGALAPTTIGAGELNFRVRDGNGCDLSAIVTRLSCDCSLQTIFIIIDCRRVSRDFLFPQN
jgi:hypothetical protein